MRRDFKILDGEGRNLDIVAKFYSLGGQAPYFSITSQRGSNHVEMVACAPPEVADDIAALVAVHLCSADGVPMHAVANSTYHMEQGDMDAARRCLGAPATQDDVVRLATKRAQLGVLKAPGVTEGMRAALVAAAKAVADADDLVAGAKTDGRSFLPLDRLHAALANFKDVASGKDPLPTDQRPDRERLLAGKKLLDTATHKHALSVAATGPTAEDGKAIKSRADKLMTAEAVEDLLEDGGLRDRWFDAADRAREALGRPDFRIASRPDPAVDTTTFGGFAAVNGLSLEILGSKPIENRRVHCDCRLTHAGTGETYDFDFSGPREPVIADVLELFQSDCGGVLWSDLDSFLDELGYTGSAKTLREGEKAYEGCNREGRALVSMLGEDRMADFLSKVGDNPIHLTDGLPAGAFSADAPAPAPGMR